MESTAQLYHTIVKILSQHKKWLDMRHLYTLAYMVVGLIQSETVNLTQWIPYVISRAKFAQSTQRRFARWLHNKRIEVHRLYAPLIQKALSHWGEHTIYLTLDTTMLWEKYCVICIAIVYRGRAVPIAWKVLDHQSATVSFLVYKELLSLVAPLLPTKVKVLLLADRGFADTQLMRLSLKLGWHYRIRIKKNFWVYRKGKKAQKVGRFSLSRGRAIYLQKVYLTQEQMGPVHLALAICPNGQAWYVVSSEPACVQTFFDYGKRFSIEESFLDQKSNGFDLESSQIRDADSLSRLYFVLAIATLFLVSTGTGVVKAGKRRRVDCHWFRGNSYLRIGWQWIKTALVRGWKLSTQLALEGGEDPQMGIASKKQCKKHIAKQLNIILSLGFR